MLLHSRRHFTAQSQVADSALPLFPEPLPRQKRGIEGWCVGARAAYPDTKAKRLESHGTVIAVLPGLHQICIRPDHREVQLLIDPARCRRIA